MIITENTDVRKLKHGFITLEDEAKDLAKAKEIALQSKNLDKGKITVKIDSKTSKLLPKRKAMQLLTELRTQWMIELSDMLDLNGLTITEESSDHLVIMGIKRGVKVEFNRKKLFYNNKKTIFNNILKQTKKLWN